MNDDHGRDERPKALVVTAPGINCDGELALAFEAAGARVFGVSKDSLESHDKFRAKQELTVPLLSDEHGSLCEDLDVWTEKKMYGKSFMGIERSTFLIDAAGTVVRAWRKVKVPGHVDDVLAAVKAL